MNISLDYMSIAIFAIIVLVAMIITVMLPKLIGPGAPLAIVDVKPKQKPVYKYETYECGEIPVGDARVRYDIEYYIFPIVFLVFDVVTAFLLLWAIVFW
ncbi:MAG: NADH-quinone oxidoreductase subunit A [Candidatus Asgardarchaeia archaeon]